MWELYPRPIPGLTQAWTPHPNRGPAPLWLVSDTPSLHSATQCSMGGARTCWTIVSPHTPWCEDCAALWAVGTVTWGSSWPGCLCSSLSVPVSTPANMDAHSSVTRKILTQSCFFLGNSSEGWAALDNVPTTTELGCTSNTNLGLIRIVCADVIDWHLVQATQYQLEAVWSESRKDKIQVCWNF